MWKEKFAKAAALSVCLLTALTCVGCDSLSSLSTGIIKESSYTYYTEKYKDISYSWVDCVAQTDERAASSDEVRITMVEAKYFAVTEKYECRLVEVIGKKFRFVMELPHGAWQHIIIDGTHMVDDFAAVANGFDKNAWVDQWVQVSKEYSDVPDRTGLEEDATYHQETLKKIANELAEAEKQPDIGLVTINYFGYYGCSVDSRSLSYDVEQMVKNSKVQCGNSNVETELTEESEESTNESS